MRFVAEPIPDLRLKRFHRWAMLWLKWFVSFLDRAGAFAPISEQAQTIGHRWLHGIERVVLNVAMLRAAPHVRGCNKRRGMGERRLKEIALRRAIIGSAMRRALRPKGLRQRIEALTQSIDALVAHLLRRLPRGLTRRRPIKAKREAHAAAPCARHSLGALLSDTS